MKRWLIALVLALSLLRNHVRAQGGIGYGPGGNDFVLYAGVYYTSWLYPVYGMRCEWVYVTFANGSGFYSDTCTGTYYWI